MHRYRLCAAVIFACLLTASARAQEICPRSAPGSAIPEPEDLRSQDGVLKVEFSYRSFVDDHGLTRYCYIARDGSESPTLRVRPGRSAATPPPAATCRRAAAAAPASARSSAT